METFSEFKSVDAKGAQAESDVSQVRYYDVSEIYLEKKCGRIFEIFSST